MSNRLITLFTLLALATLTGCKINKYEGYIFTPLEEDSVKFIPDVLETNKIKRLLLITQKGAVYFDSEGLLYSQSQVNSNTLPRSAFTELKNPESHRQYYDILRIKSFSSTDENEANLRRHYQEEYDAIKDAGRHQEIGLALSGGGIRSGTIASGVLQGLEELGLLKDIGYISSVSGGGYTAGWYLARKNRYATESAKLAQAGLTDYKYETANTNLLKQGSRDLGHLSAFGNYLYAGSPSVVSWDNVNGAVRLLWGIPFHALFNNPLLDYNVNVIGPRKRYRNGLARGYLYKTPYETEGSAFCRFHQGLIPLSDLSHGEGANDLYVKDLCPNSTNNLPMWIINMHLDLNDDRGKYKNRTGLNFELTPIFAGADDVGYVHTTTNHTWMRLKEAMAISGAALDTSSGKVPFTLSGPVNVANLNLGYYVPGFYQTFWKRMMFGFPGSRVLNPFGVNSGHGRKFDSYRYYLTDGAHFNNLGVYALVKRGCRLIIVSDGTSDPLSNEWSYSGNSKKSRSFSDLRELTMQLENDFGAELEMHWAEFNPTNNNTTTNGYGNITASTVFVGKIKNLNVLNEEDDGVTIIYIKAAYTNRDQLLNTFIYTDAEKDRNPDFPNRTTGDQFYSERQVLSHRAIGRESVLANKALFTNAFNSIISNTTISGNSKCEISGRGSCTCGNAEH